MEIDKDKFRKTYPNLAKEMNIGKQKVSINSIRTRPKNGGKKAKGKDNLSNYTPDIIAFLRRCDTKQQAEEIIDYMENRGEITPNYAKKIRQQLKKRGLRSFGPKREEGYYFNACR